MYKKFIAFTAGAALLAMGTIVPAMAATTATPDVNVDVLDYITFSIGNASGNCTVTAGGECPFKTGVGTAQALTAAGVNDSAFATSTTQLSTTTNSTDGYNVTAFAVNTAGNSVNRTTALLVSGGTGAVADDQIVDTVTQIADAGAENLDTLTTAEQAVDTGLAIRLTDTTGGATSPDCRGTDEDTQWGTGDDNNGVGAAQANWASLAVAATDQGDIIYDCPSYDDLTTNGYINYFIGVSSTQKTGLYDAKVTFTAQVN